MSLKNEITNQNENESREGLLKELPFHTSYKVNGVPISELENIDELSTENLTKLLEARGKELMVLAQVADAMRERDVGNIVSFVINRNVNFTNVCVGSCKFCNFKVSPGSKKGKIEFSDEEIIVKLKEAVEYGATEVCMQAGLAPSSNLEVYLQKLKLVKSVAPELHVHAFSPEEINFIAQKDEITPHEILKLFKKHGLGSIPGTAAEILDDKIRNFLAPQKLSTNQWINIVKTAHNLKIPTTSTIMYGHIETSAHIAKHLQILKEIQKETNGFTEFVPLPFIHSKTVLYNQFNARPGSTGLEDLALHAVSRIYLGESIKNIQASWVKMGTKFSQTLLNCGINDLGGTLLEESISRLAGATHGIALHTEEFIRIIRDANKIPMQRNTKYEALKIYPENDNNTDKNENTYQRKKITPLQVI